jgi:putative addiction module component (TIGR02574 family)
MSMSSSRVSVFDLSVSEKLQLLEDLWDDIASDPASIPVHEWQKVELDRRRQNLRDQPGSALSWDEIRHRIRSRHGG